MSHSHKRSCTTRSESVRSYLEHLVASLDPEEALRRLKKKRKAVISIGDKGGIVVVSDGDFVITTYRYDSFKRC